MGHAETLKDPHTLCDFCLTGIQDVELKHRVSNEDAPAFGCFTLRLDSSSQLNQYHYIRKHFIHMKSPTNQPAVLMASEPTGGILLFKQGFYQQPPAEV